MAVDQDQSLHHELLGENCCSSSGRGGSSSCWGASMTNDLECGSRELPENGNSISNVVCVPSPPVGVAPSFDLASHVSVDPGTIPSHHEQCSYPSASDGLACPHNADYDETEISLSWISNPGGIETEKVQMLAEANVRPSVNNCFASEIRINTCDTSNGRQPCDGNNNVGNSYLPSLAAKRGDAFRSLSQYLDAPSPNQSGLLDAECVVLTDEFSSHGSSWHIDLDKLNFGDMVASGSYGMVHEGKFKDERVAIKVLLIPEASSLVELNRLKAGFRTEIDVWYTLLHPNIVQFIGAHMSPSRWAIVTEFLHGGSLKAFLMRQQWKKLPVKTMVAMALDIARGMEYLHRNNIMHRDLKSANLLLDEHGTVKVADFGLARFEAEDPRNLTAETGTIRWMAPEVICHLPYTRKIDVYSYAIVLWELCTSQVPFEGLSFVQLAHAVASDNFRPPISDCPAILSNLMTRCWDKEPQNRPDFSEIVFILETCTVEDNKYSFKTLKPVGAQLRSPKYSVKAPRGELDYSMDRYSQPTVSLRGGRAIARARNLGPSLVANTDDVLSDEEDWGYARRQCRCVIL